jgi:hypothetical protein
MPFTNARGVYIGLLANQSHLASNFSMRMIRMYNNFENGSQLKMLLKFYKDDSQC